MFFRELRFKFVKDEFLFSFQEFGNIVIFDVAECFSIYIEDIVYKSMICRIQFVGLIDSVFVVDEQGLELVFDEVRDIRGFRIRDICLHNCFEIELVNLGILLLDRKEKVGGIEQTDLLRICQFWFVIDSVHNDRCFRTMFVSFETAFSYKGSRDWYMGGALLEGGGIVGNAGNRISVEVWISCFWWCQAIG